MHITNWYGLLQLGIVGTFFAVLFYRRSMPDPEVKRRTELAALAKKLQLEFRPGTDATLAEKYAFLGWLKRGSTQFRYAYNVFHGRYDNSLITFFDYHFWLPGGKGGYDYYVSVFTMDLSVNFTDLMILHESLESKAAEMLGKEYLTFESAEFSRAFRVCAADKRFAYDVCHPQMMEYLLANQDLTLEICRNCLAICFEDWLHPQKVESNLRRLSEIRGLLPQYLFTKN